MHLSSGVDWLDFLRILTSFIGLLYMSVVLKRTIDDSIYLRNDYAKHYSTVTSVLVFAGGVIIQATFLSTGIISAIEKPPLNTNQIIYILSSLISSILARIIYIRRRNILVMLYNDKKDLEKYRTTDKQDLKDYRDVDKQDLKEYRDHDEDYTDSH